MNSQEISLVSVSVTCTLPLALTGALVTFSQFAGARFVVL
jgi:hypothetical protein